MRKICTHCLEELDIKKFEYQKTKERYRAICIECRRKTERDKKWLNLGFSSPEEGLEFNKKQTVKYNKFPGIYLLWLGEKDKYYIGSSDHFLRRKSSWIQIIKWGWEKAVDSENKKLFNEIYSSTNFISIKLLEKLEENISYEKMAIKEKEWIIKIILKHKTIYNRLV